ncbi:MAG: family 16 glycoside hydrolase [Bacteroidia bacterium]|nr:family 16 glycoside hydrolase [Bacteroidia bacterium]
MRTTYLQGCTLLLLLALGRPASAQSGDGSIPLQDLSAFRGGASGWTVAGSVYADRQKPNTLRTSPGTGVLICAGTGSNLLTQAEYGDADVELEFMMAAGSNSGIYIQGRYEIQLLDSWGTARPGMGDCGGVYQRWDESRPEGRKGYEGHAPRLNACKAPGLWQTLKISFQAPRFDPYGKKTSNARLLQVVLNGEVIHEALDLTGPTRGPLSETESAAGPLMIQGDHGAVAFRNLRIRSFSQPPARLSSIAYRQYQGRFDVEPADYQGLSPAASGTSGELSSALSRSTNEFLLVCEGDFEVPAEGLYRMQFTTLGPGRLSIDGKPVFAWDLWEREGAVQLAAGRHRFGIAYTKSDPWYPPGLGWWIEGPGMRPTALHSLGSMPIGNPVNPIFIEPAGSPVLHRSFMDFSPSDGTPARRVTHGLSAGSPSRLHYSYDLNAGTLFQLWRGGFLDATPMWNDRGDGSSRPAGMLLSLHGAPSLAVLPSESSPWPQSPEAVAGWRARGYRTDAAGHPVFAAELNGLQVQTAPVPDAAGRRLTQRVALEGPVPAGLYYRIASGTRIEQLPDGAWAVNGQQYLIELQLPPKSKVKPLLRPHASGQELLLPILPKSGASRTEFSIHYIW